MTGRKYDQAERKMNLRLSILLVAVLVLFGGTFLVVRFTGSEARTPNEPWLFRIDQDAIDHIVVTRKGQTLAFEKKPGSLKWFILKDPELPVNFERWAGVPLLLSGPRVNRVLSDTIGDPVSYGLDPPETRVKVTEGNGQGFEFHMGFSTPDESNTYARLVGYPQLFTVPTVWAEIISRLVTEPPYPRLYVIEEDEIRGIQVTSDGSTVVYRRDLFAQQFTIEGDPPVPVYAEKWEGTLSLISLPVVVEVIFENVEGPGSYGLDPPMTIAHLIKMDGSSIEFHLGIITPDQESYYARTVGEDDEVMIVPASWAQAVIALATDPPYPPEGAATAGSD